MVNAKLVQEIKIYETDRYEIFKPMHGQPKHRAAKNASKLAQEIDPEIGNIIPIIVTPDYKVIDGNTRLEAVRMLKSKVRFQIVDSDDVQSLELMKMMNAANQPWTINNFIEFYAEAYNLDEYKALRVFLENNQISVGVIQELDNRINQNDIKNGDLKKIDYSILQDKVDKLYILHDAIGYEFMKSKLHLARALNKILNYGQVNFTELIHKVKSKIKDEMKNRHMNRIDSSGSLLPILQKCYNYKRRDKKRIYDDLTE